MANGDDNAMTAPPDLPPPQQPNIPVPQSALVTAAPFDNSMATQVLAPQTTAIPSVPVQPYDPNIQPHMNWLQRALSDVSDILGGPKTYTLTKAPDGTATVTQQTSTQGEKWGRIAAAALTGAAQGLAHSVGTNALPQAAAAGFQTGMQIPVTQEQQRQKEAAFQNQQLLATANRIHLTQQAHVLGQEAQLNDIKIGDAEAQRYNAYAQELLDSPNAVDVGTIDPSDRDSARLLAAKNPAAMDAFLNKGDKVLRYVWEPDHQMHMIMADKAWTDRMNETPRTVFHEGTPGTDGKPVLETTTLDPNTAPNGKIDDYNMSILTRHYGNLKTWADAIKAEGSDGQKPVRNYQQAYDAWMNETDPAQKAARWQEYTDLRNDAQRNALASAGIQQRRLGLAEEEFEFKKQQASGQAPGDTSKTGEPYLQTLEPGLGNQVRQIVSGEAQIPKASARPGSVANQLRAAAYQADPNLTESRWATIQNFRGKNPGALQVSSLATLLEHTDQAVTNSQRLGDSPSLAVGRSLSGDAAAYKIDADWLTHESGRFIKSGGITQGEWDAGLQNIASPLESVRRKGLSELMRLVGGRVDATRENYLTGTQHPMPLQQYFDPPTIRRLQKYNLVPREALAAGAGAAAPAPTPPPAASAPPVNLLKEGVQTHFDNGQTWTLQNGKAVQVQ